MKYLSFLLFATMLPNAMQSQMLKANPQWGSLEKPEYRISCPPDWRIDDSGDSGSSFFLYSPISSEEDTYSDYIILYEQRLDGLKIDLDAFVNSAEKDIAFFYKDAKILDKQKMKKSGHDCYMMSYQGTLIDLPLRFYQYTWVINEKAYVLNFTCEPSSFASLETVAMKIMDSFQLLIK